MTRPQSGQTWNRGATGAFTAAAWLGMVSKLTWSLVIITTATQCLSLATRALLHVAWQHVQKSSGYSAIGALVADGLIEIALLVTAGNPREIPSSNAKGLERLRPLELRTLEIVFSHNRGGYAQRLNSPTAAGTGHDQRMRRPKNPAHRNRNAWRQFGGVIWLAVSVVWNSLIQVKWIDGEKWWSSRAHLLVKPTNESLCNLAKRTR